MHDYIIILIIAVIIGIQILIFWKNMSKIKKYKQTIEDVKDFEIVEVSVPEEWIKEIGVEEILQNPEKFQELSTNFSSTTEETDEDLGIFENEQINSQLDEDIEEDELLNLKLKGDNSETELVFPEDDSEIEEFEEEDFEEYKTNR